MSEAKPETGHAYRPFLTVAVLCLLGILATAGIKSYRELVAARAHEAELIRQVEQTEKRIEILRRRVRLLEEDPQTLERRAREDLSMVQPNDVVIILPSRETVSEHPEPERPRSDVP